MSQAFAVYEEEISDSKQQLASLILIMSTVKEIGFKTEDNLNPLRSQCCLNGAKLVKKSDQCRAILSASLMFADRDKKALEEEAIKCIRKAIKISSSVLDQEVQLQLFVEVLSHLTLFADFESEEIQKIVKSLVEKINEQKEETPLSELIERQYVNNVSHFKAILGNQVMTKQESKRKSKESNDVIFKNNGSSEANHEEEEERHLTLVSEWIN